MPAVLTSAVEHVNGVSTLCSPGTMMNETRPSPQFHRYSLWLPLSHFDLLRQTVQGQATHAALHSLLHFFWGAFQRFSVDGYNTECSMHAYCICTNRKILHKTKTEKYIFSTNNLQLHSPHWTLICTYHCPFLCKGIYYCMVSHLLIVQKGCKWTATSRARGMATCPIGVDIA